MNIFKLLGQILLFYILYRLIMNFIVPAYRGVKRFNRQFKQMQQNMQQNFEQQQRQAQQNRTPSQPAEKSTSLEEGEYIDFEEIKTKN